MNLTIKFSPSLADKEASFRKLSTTGIYEGLGRLAPEAASIILTNLKSAAPRRTGAFASSINYRQSVSAGAIVMKFSAPDPLAFWIINGTKPHIIEPTQPNGVLRFLAASGDVVFTRHVMHPGTKANPFHEVAWEQSKPEVVAILGRLGRMVREQLN